MNRRHFLQATGTGFSTLAFSTLLAEEREKERARRPHFRPTAKSVIFLFMSGGPSQVDTFDPKPELKKLAGREVPASLAKNVPRIQRAGLKNLMPSPWKFRRYGECGMPISELLPYTAKHADDLCVIRSMHHRNPVHGPAECVALTGTGLGDRPSIGAWSVYGLSTENSSLPGFLQLNLHNNGMQYPQAAGWGVGFLPSRFQGTVVNTAEGVRNVRMPSGTTNKERRRQLAALEWFNKRHLKSLGKHDELSARIRSYETAFRMQTAAPKLFDISRETKATRRLYGLDAKPTRQSARGCLLARRMVERGVRFVQVRIGGWDAHSGLKGNHTKMAAITDRPIAGLLTDLKQRGLLDETLVVWAGEFGRTPTMEGRGNGRDHSPAGYSVWMAGGGVQGGRIIGATDPLGYVAVQRPVSPHDCHATILHALGLDATRLTFNHHGRDEIPTVFGGKAVKEVFARV